jgi:hypothetical protein
MEHGSIEDTEQSGRDIHEFDSKHEEMRVFWREFPDYVGASNGEKTRFIIVRWYRNGSFHGFPVTRERLRFYGAEL